jgi:hypothetical protein
MLRAAAARAGGQLRALDVSEWEFDLSWTTLQAVVQANGTHLLELRAWGFDWLGHEEDTRNAEVEEDEEDEEGDLPVSMLRRLLTTAAPLLHLLECDAYDHTSSNETVSLLRKEAPFEAVSLRSCSFSGDLPIDAAAFFEAECRFSPDADAAPHD